MNNYTAKLNLPLVIDEVDFNQYYKQGKRQIRCDNNILKQSTHDWLRSQLGIEIQWLEIFCLKPFEKHIIHSDGHEVDTKAKINYIVGGTGSSMIWYNASDDKIIKGMSRANTRYLTVNDHDAQEVHRAELEGFNLVNVGALHTVKNKSELRYCISMALADSVTKQRLDYSELASRLRDYL